MTSTKPVYPVKFYVILWTCLAVLSVVFWSLPFGQLDEGHRDFLYFGYWVGIGGNGLLNILSFWEIYERRKEFDQAGIESKEASPQENDTKVSTDPRKE